MEQLPQTIRRSRDSKTEGIGTRPGGGSGRPASAAPPNMPRRVWPIFALVLLINYIVMRSLFPGPDSPIKVPYTTFREEVERGNVSAIYSRGTNIEGRFVKP